jgi:hypothetical protein
MGIITQRYKYIIIGIVITVEVCIFMNSMYLLIDHPGSPDKP